jgi:hypothetical protein
MGVTVARRRRTTTLLAGIRAGGTTPAAFPGACSSGAQWLSDKSGTRRPVHLPLRGQRRLGKALQIDGAPSCFPLNCGM